MPSKPTHFPFSADEVLHAICKPNTFLRRELNEVLPSAPFPRVWCPWQVERWIPGAFQSSSTRTQALEEPGCACDLFRTLRDSTQLFALCRCSKDRFPWLIDWWTFLFNWFWSGGLKWLRISLGIVKSLRGWFQGVQLCLLVRMTIEIQYVRYLC
jgi:hypothetical protein